MFDCQDFTPRALNLFPKNVNNQNILCIFASDYVRRGRKSPLLLTNRYTTAMIDKLQVLEIIDNALAGTDKFLVDLKISTDNRINVAIDGDNGIVIDDCVNLSRLIENSLDRDSEDFELNVSSAGLDSPLKLKRQYIKNIGQELTVTTFDGETTEGKLVSADNDKISLKLLGRKNAGTSPVEINYADIKTAKIIIKF